jgi:hypothetical protein
MAIDIVTPRSRRAVLAASLGGIAAAMAAALGRPEPARANEGDAIILGTEHSGTIDGSGTHEASSTTAIATSAGIGLKATSPTSIGLWGESISSTGVVGFSQSGIGVHGGSEAAQPGVAGQSHANGTGVFGFSGVAGQALPGAPANTGVYGLANQVGSRGVHGKSQSGQGVWGESVDATGVVGSSESHIGVHGGSSAPARAGVAGQSHASATGVFGFSGLAGQSLPASPAKTGVFGQATQDSNSRGVHGKSNSGRGVFGEASSGQGVRGFATSGSGLYGAASTGFALRTVGRIRLEKSAGIAQVNAGTNNVVVSPGIDLTSTTAVIATLQGTAGGTTTVHRVVVDTAANTFRIWLTANAAGNVKVAWLTFG